jgi:hypothetical protein
VSDEVTADDKAAAREMLKAQSAPGKHSTVGWKPYTSGFCKDGQAPEVHAQCRGVFGPKQGRCTCAHHEWPED